MNDNEILKHIDALFDEIYYSQLTTMQKASELIKEARINNNTLYFFGQGHSVLVGKDVENCYPMKIVACQQISDSASEIYKYYGVKENDLFVLVSNSGINEVIINLAIYLKENNHKIIVINSNKHTMYTKSRHPSGLKLYQLADVSIDNCCKFGDVDIKNSDDELASLSSIMNNTIAHSIIKNSFK